MFDVMKKIRIITIHFGVNYGSALQAYALTNYLNEKGADSKIIDYIPERYNLWGAFYKKNKAKYPLPIILAYFPVVFFKLFPNRCRFRKFLKKYVPMTEKYNQNDDLMEGLKDCDVFVAGSDQIWNSDYNGEVNSKYYLDFVPSGSKKISYAASFGKQYPLNQEEIDRVTPYLKDFSAISVREKDAVNIIEQCGLHSTHVCDPTFLLTKEQWKMFSGDAVISKKYVLVYVMDGIHKILIDNAEKIAKANNLDIYVIAFKTIHDNRITRQFVKADPKQFLSLFSGAGYVVTNSFHGTAFSVIFNRQFLVVGKENYNERMLSLLGKCELKDRFILFDHVINESELEKYNQVIDWNEVNNHIQPWIAESKEYIMKNILQEG